MTGREALALVAGALAALRITRLVTTDDLTAHWRMLLAQRLGRSGHPHPVVVLVNCQWCAGVWITAAAASFLWATGLVGSWPVALVGWWAMAGATGLLLERANA